MMDKSVKLTEIRKEYGNEFSLEVNGQKITGVVSYCINSGVNRMTRIYVERLVLDEDGKPQINKDGTDVLQETLSFEF